MSDLLFELVGPNYGLAESEILARIEGLSFDFTKIQTDKGILALKTDCPAEKFSQRLGLTHRLLYLIGITSDEDFFDLMEGYDLSEGNVAIRTRKIGGHEAETDTKNIKEQLGKIISEKNPIDLDSPEHEIFVLISKDLYVGKKVHERDKKALRSREVKNRPYSSPISLKPKLTRALINLARPGRGDRIHDPFCGTGGILIEGSKMGFEMSGGDKDEKMIEGCRENLEEFDVDASLKVGDVSETIPQNIDCITTDPPYGRASSTSKEDLSSIYERLFSSAQQRLKKNGHLSVIFPENKYVEMGKKYLELIEKHKVRVHRSLDRYFCVFKKGE
ncbi:MAG: methyltransferase [Candidatus Thermoplasmatota archaeon]|nr:methyltransferase [Candidatus Thermoplasmatota archaeon]